VEPDLDGLWSIAVEALDEDERGQVLAWLVGTIDLPGHTGRADEGERDVVLLLPDRLVVVQPHQSAVWVYGKDQVGNIRFPRGHLSFDVYEGYATTNVEFWIDSDLLADDHFRAQAEEWLATEQSSSGCGFAVLAVVVAIVGLLYVFGPADWNPPDSRLNARSTCGEFLRAGEDRQLDLLRRLFQEAGRPADAEKPAVLTQSRRRCEQNGSVTLDSLITGR
jgi:hypothetical protein